MDVRTTFRNVALCISHNTVMSLYTDAEVSEPVSLSGESLLDMMGGDGHKPKRPTSVEFKVVSLRETATLLSPSHEYYAVVPNMLKITHADGNMNCGTDPTVGDAAFLEVGGGSVDGCAAMLKKGEIAVFAIQIKKATTTVEIE